MSAEYARGIIQLAHAREKAMQPQVALSGAMTVGSTERTLLTIAIIGEGLPMHQCSLEMIIGIFILEKTLR